MNKNPVYILPLITLYIFSFGYVYEWGYLSAFNVASEVVGHSYSEFLVLATHALTVAIRNESAINAIFITSTIIGVIYSVIKSSFYKNWVEKNRKNTSEIRQFFISIFTISMSPIIILVLFLMPGLLGNYEAIALKKSSEKNWQEIELIGKEKYEGIKIRSFGGNVLFYQKNDPITHINQIKSIRTRTTSHNKTLQPDP